MFAKLGSMAYEVDVDNIKFNNNCTKKNFSENLDTIKRFTN